MPGYYKLRKIFNIKLVSYLKTLHNGNTAYTGTSRQDKFVVKRTNEGEVHSFFLTTCKENKHILSFTYSQ